MDNGIAKAEPLDLAKENADLKEKLDALQPNAKIWDGHLSGPITVSGQKVERLERTEPTGLDIIEFYNGLPSDCTLVEIRARAAAKAFGVDYEVITSLKAFDFRRALQVGERFFGLPE